MLNEKECSVMQIQILDEKTYWTKRNVYLVMDDKLDWLRVFVKKVCGKNPHINCSCKKVKYE